MIDRSVVAVLQIKHPVSEGPHRQGVRADEHLALTIANHQGRAVARAEDHLVFTDDEHAQGVGPAQAVERRLERRQGLRTLDQILVDQVSHHLGVGIAGKDPALGLEFGFQLGEVFDNAVVHHRDPAGDMWMGVALGRPSVSGPTRMADAGLAGQGILGQHSLKLAQLARRPAALQHAIHQGGDACGVVAPVLQALEALDQTRRGRAGPDNADDAAHGSNPPRKARRIRS